MNTQTSTVIKVSAFALFAATVISAYQKENSAPQNYCSAAISKLKVNRTAEYGNGFFFSIYRSISLI